MKTAWGGLILRYGHFFTGHNWTLSCETKGGAMNIDPKVLTSKLIEMYPEIKKHDLDVSACFDEKKDAWIVQLAKGKHELTTHLERKDAEACLDGVQCIYLGVQIGQFVKNFESS
jgi:hypothetical protein